jgi:hypothetical protein
MRERRNETITGKNRAGLVPKTKMKPKQMIGMYFKFGLFSINDFRSKKQPIETKTYPAAVGTSFML